MQLTQPLRKALRERPHADAVVCGQRRRSFAQLHERVARLGTVLRELGVNPGDRVGMMALNSHYFVEFMLGVWWCGGVINPVNIRWSPKEVAYSLDDCDTSILLVDDRFAPAAAALRGLSRSLRTVVYCGEGAVPDGMLGYEALLASTAPCNDAMRGGNDLAAIMYTGGTTGLPKGVMLSHDNIYIGALGSIAAAPRNYDAVIGLVVAPMFHIAGCSLSVQMMLRMTTQVILPMFEEVPVMQAVHQERITDMFLVPTMIKRLIEHPRFAEFDLGSLRTLLYGAAPIDATLLAQAMKALPGTEFAQAYGMTELSPTVSLLHPKHHLPGPDQAKHLRSAGLPLPIAEIRIVDAEDHELPRGQVGEIVARGSMVMQGYWNKPEATAQAVRDGWMHTGDGGYMDEDGFIYVADRIKDMIISGGENVYSAEVENAIAQLPQVSMCAVIGVPDEQWGERVHAVIVLRESMTIDAAAVIAHCRDLIAGYKCPRSVEFRQELPVSAAGKLQKFVLRAPFWAEQNRRIN